MNRINQYPSLLPSATKRSGLRAWRSGKISTRCYVTTANIVAIQAGDGNYPFNARGRVDVGDNLGQRLHGEWDRQVVAIESTLIYRGLHQRVNEGKSWLQTCLNPHVYKAEHQNLPRKYESYTIEEFERRGSVLDALIMSMRKNGWMVEFEKQHAFRPSDGLYLNVTRDGQFVRNAGGMHRLILSKLIGIEAVPAIINVIHAECDPEPPIMDRQ